MEKQIKYYSEDGVVVAQNKQEFDEIKPRFIEETIIKVVSYNIGQDNLQKFGHYIGDAKASQIVFITAAERGYKTRHDTAKNILKRKGQSFKLLNKEELPGRNSADYIGLILN